MKELFTQGNIAAALTLIALMIACLLLLIIAVQPTMNRIEWSEETYIVKSGDTLWAIASDYCPDIVDKREWIEEVKDLNGIHDSNIRAGQRLTVLVPAE